MLSVAGAGVPSDTGRVERRLTIKQFILGAAALVSLLMFGAMYAVVSTLYDSTVKEDARNVTDVLAGQTFNAMFQVMRKGWTRDEVMAFITASHATLAETPYTLEIYRGPRTERLFGRIPQPPIDTPLAEAMASGTQVRLESETGLRYLFPLTARQECLRCHVNAAVGDTLGAIEVKADLQPLAEKARHDFLVTLALIAPLPFAVAFGVAFYLNRKINRAITRIDRGVTQVNRVSDLRHIVLHDVDIGFAEFGQLMRGVGELVERMRGIAVDKDLLELELRLLEKLIITPDVARDWREYTAHLLLEINHVLKVCGLFVVIQTDGQREIEMFWREAPPEPVREAFERYAVDHLRDKTPSMDTASAVFRHTVARTGTPVVTCEPYEMVVRTRSLFVAHPRIGGVVGVGLQTDIAADDPLALAVDGVLSTLLNVIGSVKTIHEHTRNLEYYATRDPLTGLYNQRLFWELLEYEIARAKRGAYRFALLVVDLDNFKTVNDSHGHAFGDRFLQEFAQLLRQAVRQGDLLARYGGDEFVAVVSDLEQERPLTVARRILALAAAMAFPAPDGSYVGATCSVGIAVYPEHAAESKDLFLFADNMMYRAKGDGKNRVGLPDKAEAIESIHDHGTRTQAVLRALEERRLVPYFEPICDTQNGRIVAHESLSRLDIGGEHVGAAEFIDRLEHMGIAHRLDYLAMQKSFEKVAREHYRGLLFSNLSPRMLLIEGFADEARQLVVRYGVDPAQIVFEITERDTVRNMNLLEQFMRDLKQQGFRFAIDDFGSGFSSYHYIRRLPVDFIKIEGDFITNMLNSTRDHSIVTSIVTLAHQLDIRTIAEHVESGEILESVAAAGVEYVQGYYVGRASPAFMT